MIDAAETAIGFVKRRTRGDLDTDRMLLLALERAIEIIGETASKVSDRTREGAPSIPWPQIAGMRNRLIHAYFDIDRNILWKTVTEEIPALLEQLRRLDRDE
ncbi:MAG: DUF86 domain-containing protein [Alphaproteobacteria bacterium]|nr:DUF86 domain-containing protein [Alphaproteobacteria bacterium]